MVETLGISFCRDCTRGATLRGRPQLSKFAHPEQEEKEIFCTFCLDAPKLAAKSCVQCESSLCEDHLRVHCQSVDHILIPPMSSINKRKCPDHKKLLQYYCCEDAICVCMDCCQTGEHKGHQTETLNGAFEKEKRNLRILLEQLTLTREEIEKRGQVLEERWEREKEKVAGEKERITSLFRDITRHLEDLERRLLAEISGQGEQISQLVSNLFQKLEIQKGELSMKMCQIKELCDTADPLTVLLDSKSQADDVSEYIDHVKLAWPSNENILPPMRESIHGLASVTVHKSLTDIITQSTKLKGYFLEEVSDIQLDEKTCARDLEISADQKTVSWSSVKPFKPRMSMRKKNKQIFECSQVLSTRNFSSGRYFWAVEIGEEGGVRLGVTYANPIRRGTKFHIGENEKSWCLRVWYQKYSAIYNRRPVSLNSKVECNKVGVFLDYRAGQLSFYELGSTIRHLHTFTTTFTEPLYAAFWIHHSWVKIIS
ncbi:E3 ubiquitin-protein ligase TRIM39-like [Aquarana catesbeiana]|uniref:E3 ubiquitin-protein ligase TRIM39-like n=1 Tax=Aquarana catesbeiana TaxID=8400 RepID=UPI003CC9D966